MMETDRGTVGILPRRVLELSEYPSLDLLHKKDTPPARLPGKEPVGTSRRRSCRERTPAPPLLILSTCYLSLTRREGRVLSVISRVILWEFGDVSGRILYARCRIIESFAPVATFVIERDRYVIRRSSQLFYELFCEITHTREKRAIVRERERERTVL